MLCRVTATGDAPGVGILEGGGRFLPRLVHAARVMVRLDGGKTLRFRRHGEEHERDGERERPADHSPGAGIPSSVITGRIAPRALFRPSATRAFSM